MVGCRIALRELKLGIINREVWAITWGSCPGWILCPLHPCPPTSSTEQPGPCTVRLGIQLLPVIAGIVHLPVFAQLKGQLLPLEDPDPTDGGFVALAEQTTGYKKPFSWASKRWNIPPMRLQDMKTMVSSSLYLWSPLQMGWFSWSKCSKNEALEGSSALLE